MSVQKIGLGGGCHWCTEAVFQSLRGVTDVAQGFISLISPHDTYSEAVIVTFDATEIPLTTLIDVHLRTHASTSAHKMRSKYRSAVYTHDAEQAEQMRAYLARQQAEFDNALITQTLPLVAFKPSDERFQNYYATDGTRPFCTTYIDPKLALIRREFARYATPQAE